MSTAEQKIQLIKEVAQKAYDETESWSSEDEVGTDLAYLFWEIVKDGYYVMWPGATFDILMQDWFPKDHAVWGYIKYALECNTHED